MHRLPLELLSLIFKNLTCIPYLKALRLLNKAFAAAVAPLLFNEIPLWIGGRSLESLVAISKHPQLSRYPRKIHFSPLRFIGYPNNGDYEDNVLKLLDYEPPFPLAKYMSAYSNYIEAQRLLSLNASDVQILSGAFSRLPRLESVHFDFQDRTIGAGELKCAFGTFNPESLLTYDCRHTLPVLVQALAASQIKIKIFELGRDIDDSDSITFGGVSDYASPKSLWPRIASTTPDDGFPAGLSETFCAENTKICKDALGSVRMFTFAEFDIPEDYLVNLSMTTTALSKLMEFASSLETVTLRGIWDLEFTNIPRPTMDSVLPCCGLNKIKKLDIQFYKTSIASLSDFFDRHGSTVVEVKFKHVDLTEGDWSGALVQLRTLKFPLLEIFDLTCFYDWTMRLQVQDFLLKKTDKDPLVEYRETLKKYQDAEEITPQSWEYPLSLDSSTESTFSATSYSQRCK